MATVEIASVDWQADQLRGSQPGGVEQMQHCKVSHRDGRARFTWPEQGVDLGHGKRFGQASADFWPIDIGGWVGRQFAAFMEKTEKSLQRRQPPGIGTGAEVPFVAMGEKTLDLLAADIPQVVVLLAADKTKKRLDVSMIGGDSVVCQPPLNNQLLQENVEMFVEKMRLQGVCAGGRKTPWRLIRQGA